MFSLILPFSMTKLGFITRNSPRGSSLSNVLHKHYIRIPHVMNIDFLLSVFMKNMSAVAFGFDNLPATTCEKLSTSIIPQYTNYPQCANRFEIDNVLEIYLEQYMSIK